MSGGPANWSEGELADWKHDRVSSAVEERKQKVKRAPAQSHSLETMNKTIGPSISARFKRLFTFIRPTRDKSYESSL